MLVEQANKDHLSQLWGVLIQPWTQGKETLEGGGGAIFVHCHEQLQIVCSLRGEQDGLESMGGMVGMNHPGREGNHSGHPP